MKRKEIQKIVYTLSEDEIRAALISAAMSKKSECGKYPGLGNNTRIIFRDDGSADLITEFEAK